MHGHARQCTIVHVRVYQKFAAMRCYAWPCIIMQNVARHRKKNFFHFLRYLELCMNMHDHAFTCIFVHEIAMHKMLDRAWLYIFMHENATSCIVVHKSFFHGCPWKNGSCIAMQSHAWRLMHDRASIMGLQGLALSCTIMHGHARTFRFGKKISPQAGIEPQTFGLSTKNFSSELNLQLENSCEM